MTVSSCNQSVVPAGPSQTPEILRAAPAPRQSATTSVASSATDTLQGLVFVYTDEIRGVTGIDQTDSDGDEYALKPEPTAIAVLIVVVAGAALFIVSRRKRLVVGLVLVSAAYGLSFPLLVYPWLNIRYELSYVGRLHFEWGYWVLCASLLAAVAVHGTEMRLFTKRWTLIPVLGIPALVDVFFSLTGE